MFEGADGLSTQRFRVGACDAVERKRFETTIAQTRPSLVVIDTLRALFDLDEKEAA
jgi:hypothetical protein